MIKKYINKIKTLKRLGLDKAIRIIIEQLILRILSKIFKFDSWHVYASITARPYRLSLSQIVNELNEKTVVEVGCGLGEILIRIKAENIYGLDIDYGVIKAAKFLHGSKVKFIHGGLEDIKLSRVDVLILVNWIHEISPTDLEEQLTPILSRTKYLLMDALDSDVPGYKHDFHFLHSKTELLLNQRTENEKRSFILFKVKQ